MSWIRGTEDPLMIAAPTGATIAKLRKMAAFVRCQRDHQSHNGQQDGNDTNDEAAAKAREESNRERHNSKAKPQNCYHCNNH